MKKLVLLTAMIGLAAALTVRADGAKDNWDTLCAKCHGPEGKGDTKMGTKLGCKDFTDAAVQADIKDDAAFKALKEGLKSDDDKTLMKPFDQLSDDDIKALVAYVHTLKKSRTRLVAGRGVFMPANPGNGTSSRPGHRLNRPATLEFQTKTGRLLRIK